MSAPVFRGKGLPRGWDGWQTLFKFINLSESSGFFLAIIISLKVIYFPMDQIFSSLLSFFKKGRMVFFGIFFVLSVVVVFSVIFVLSSKGTNGKILGISPMVSRGSSNSIDSISDVYMEKGMSFTPPIYNETPASTASLPQDRKVIRNGSLSILVNNAESAIFDINKVADDMNGFVEYANIYEVSEGVKSGSATIRVPSDKFTEAIEKIKSLAIKVERESIDSRDVSAEYVDLEARIKNYRFEERQYQEIMDKALKIQDILDVASRLAEVRGRIERTEGQLNHLSRQIDMSAISISLTAEPEVQVFGIIWRPFTVIKQSVRSFIADITGFVDWLIGFIFKIPIYLLRITIAVAIVWFGLRVLVWLKRKFWG